jgi:SET domain-containing protein
MIQLVSPRKVIVKTSPGRGLGCFASEKIFKDEIFEETYLLRTKSGEFSDYMFKYPKKDHTHLVLPTGFGSIYNHSNSPNATWRDHPNIDPNLYEIFQFYALKDIEEGEEIFTYYGGEGYWASRKGVTLI